MPDLLISWRCFLHQEGEVRLWGGGCSSTATSPCPVPEGPIELPRKHDHRHHVILNNGFYVQFVLRPGMMEAAWVVWDFEWFWNIKSTSSRQVNNVCISFSSDSEQTPDINDLKWERTFHVWLTVSVLVVYRACSPRRPRHVLSTLHQKTEWSKTRAVLPPTSNLLLPPARLLLLMVVQIPKTAPPAGGLVFEAWAYWSISDSTHNVPSLMTLWCLPALSSI